MGSYCRNVQIMNPCGRPRSRYLRIHSSPPAATISSRGRRKPDMAYLLASHIKSSVAIFILIACFIVPAQAVYLSFENCLEPSTLNSNPQLLQWTPLFFDARFNQSAPSHNLNITIYGNVTGKSRDGDYPPPNDPRWNDPGELPWAKIRDVDLQNNKRTTLFSKYQVLTFTAYDAPAAPFCNATVNASCPIAPRFFANASNPAELAAFTVAHDFYASYSFATFQTTIIVQAGDVAQTDLACISASITPGLGATLSNVLRYLPMVILIIVAVATVSAAIFSPWGTTDVFRWTSNYGRDEDLLRLVTPGFGDCLQYIQFIVLAGSLSLNYPGYFQPVVSKAAWSTLLFNESFVSGGDGTNSLVDGVYHTNSTYGLERLSQLVGLESVEDIWASMVIWTLVIVGIVVVICQGLFFFRWTVKRIAKTSEQDLRHKNWPFTGGMLVRIVCNYFLLPIVTLSMFQFVVADRSKGVVVAMAVILLVLILLFAAWILRLIITTKKRSSLFDELPIVLLYGPLYNTYTDEATAFALVPALLTFMRGVAIGAVQPSGIAQLVILAICEIVLVLTLHTFRPFHSPTSMNTYHTFFASVRFFVIMLMIAFIPGLGITEAPKGWVGYAILILHAIVLVFGFFLNAVQTLIEVIARAAGAGGDEETGVAARGGLSKVFGMRQLSRRPRNPAFRQSMNSEAAILTDDGDAKSTQLGSRSRSMSASSAILLNRHMTPESTALEPMSPGDPDRTSYHPDMVIQGAGRRPDLAVRTGEISDPYYRPPRPRRPTGELMTPGAKSRGSMGSGDWANAGAEMNTDQPRKDSAGRPMSTSPPHAAPNPAFVRHRDDSDTSINRRANVDYAVREVDFYYGVRGPALSAQPTRKLKTGPADPVGPVSSATGWFKTMFGGKKKDSSKGFEVVRSTRAPPQEFEEDEHPREVFAEPYRDSPQPKETAVLPGQRTRSTDGENRDVAAGEGEEENGPSPWNSEDESIDEASGKKRNRVSDIAPSLAPIDTGGGIELPSRFGSKASRISSRHPSNRSGPSVPRRSSQRKAHGGGDPPSPFPRLSAIESSPRGSAYSNTRVPFVSQETTEDRPGTQLNSMLSVGSGRGASQEDQRQSSSTTRTQDERIYANEQPPGIREVAQHRASDGIHAPATGTTPTGSAAELVESTPRVSTTQRDVPSDQQK